MSDPIGEAGWRLDVDPGDGELRLEHVDSGATYVLDSDGGVRPPGGEDVGSELRALQSTAASLRDDSVDGGSAIDTHADSGTGACTVSCDETTGEVTIHGATTISVRSPVVDVTGRKRVDVSSVGGVNVTAEDRFGDDTA